MKFFAVQYILTCVIATVFCFHPQRAEADELVDRDQGSCDREYQYFLRLARAARTVAHGDQYAEYLMEQFDQGVRATCMGGDAEIYADEREARLGYFTSLLVLRPEQVTQVRVSVPETFSYNQIRFTVVMREKGIPDWMLGVVMLHELAHWDDVFITERERSGAAYTPEWYQGELRAHAFENRLIDNHFQNGLSALMKSVLDNETDSRTHPEMPWLRLPTDQGWKRFERLWPSQGLDQPGQGLRNAMLLTMFGFLQSEQAERRLTMYKFFSGQPIAQND